MSKAADLLNEMGGIENKEDTSNNPERVESLDEDALDELEEKKVVASEFADAKKAIRKARSGGPSPKDLKNQILLDVENAMYELSKGEAKSTSKAMTDLKKAMTKVKKISGFK